MPKFFSPGDLISDAAGLTGDNRHLPYVH